MPAATYGRSDADTRRRLAAVREDISKVRDLRAEARQARDEAREKFAKANRSGAITEWPEFAAAQDAVGKLGEIEERLSALVADENDLLSDLGMAQPGRENGNSVGFLGDPQVRETLGSVAATKMPFGRVNLGYAMSGDDLAAQIGMYAAAGDGITTLPSGDARRGTDRGIVPPLQRPLRLLDLIPSGTMDGGSVPFLREIPSTIDAAEVTEGAVKPMTDIGFEDDEAKASTIAVWTKLLKATLADVSALESAIRFRLTRKVMSRIEAQVLAGNGAGDNLRGLLNTTGVAVPDVSAFTLPTDRVLEGVLDVLDSEAVPNGIAISTRDWGDILRLRATGGNEQYMNGVGAFVDVAERLWGIPTVPSPAIPTGKAVVGDFAQGCTLLVREGVTVAISDSDSDDFVRNRVTMLAETRVAFVVWSPVSFAIVDFTTVP